MTKIPDIKELQPLPPVWTDKARRAVVVLLFLENPDTSIVDVVLTRRTLTVGSHKGQIGFAGGRVEPEDKGPWATACREIGEELGIPSHVLEPIGMLPERTSLDGASVVPIVAIGRFARSDLVLQADEVADVLFVPWNLLTRDQAERFQFNIFGRWRNSHVFHANNSLIWGLTAQILYHADFCHS